MTRRAAWLLIWFCWLAPAASAMAESRAVDLELVLATDISNSMDTEEAQLVRQGSVNAIRHPDVIAAIQKGYYGRIAVSYVEWGGEDHQDVLVDWTEISSAAEAEAFADRVERGDVMAVSRTSISQAIVFAVGRFGRGGFEGRRRVIDISGDGPNNSGGPVRAARDWALKQGIVINGLPIINDRMQRDDYPTFPDLDLYYEDCVIGGQGSFLVVANGFQDFARAIQKKLVLEISGLAPPRSLAIPVAIRPRPPCDAGEIQLEDYYMRQFLRPPGPVKDF